MAISIVLLHAAMAWVGRQPGVLTRQDDSRYLVLAEALRAGTYRDLMWPGAPLHHMYPPGYPALLAIAGSVREGFSSAIVLQILLSAGALLLFYDAARRRVGIALSLASLVPATLNPFLLDLVGQVASEPALMFSAILAVWASVALPQGRSRTMLLVFSALLAPAVRAAGVAVSAAVVVYLWLEWRPTAAILATAAIGLGVGALLWWTFSDPYAVVGSSYAGDALIAMSSTGQSSWRVLVERVLQNGEYYTTRGLPWTMAMPSFEGVAIDNATNSGILVVTLVVCARPMYERFRLGWLVAMATIALLALWAWAVGRFVVPIVPLLLLSVIVGLKRINAALKSWRPNVPSSVWVIVPAAMSLRAASVSVNATSARSTCDRSVPMSDSRCLSREQAAYFGAVAFVRDSTPSTARVLSAKSEPLFYYARRLTVPLQRFAPLADAEFWPRVEGEQQVSYVLLASLQLQEPGRLRPLLSKRCSELALRWHRDNLAAVFEVLKSPAADDAACRFLADYARSDFATDVRR